jgi:hypothetical protein
VPHALVGQQLDVALTTHAVEVLHQGAPGGQPCPPGP